MLLKGVTGYHYLNGDPIMLRGKNLADCRYWIFHIATFFIFKYLLVCDCEGFNNSFILLFSSSIYFIMHLSCENIKICTRKISKHYFMLDKQNLLKNPNAALNMYNPVWCIRLKIVSEKCVNLILIIIDTIYRYTEITYVFKHLTTMTKQFFYHSLLVIVVRCSPAVDLGVGSNPVSMKLFLGWF